MTDEVKARLVMIKGGRVHIHHSMMMEGVTAVLPDVDIQQPMVTLIFSRNEYMQYAVSQDVWELIKLAAREGVPWEEAVPELLPQITKGFLVTELSQNYQPPSDMAEQHMPLHMRRRSYELVEMQVGLPPVLNIVNLDLQAVNEARRVRGPVTGVGNVNIEIAGVDDGE